ncbi:hypothetical protein AJ78_01589 [Emergomyces pasteurianus Ep9510]|uniref:Extracellular membrane protein CFEM domain-containing protein n=1 Tax=Emergomyces pasteurianus Ep9510 TaxID=1447872 RepID=A0A1J9PPP7_9EURO|nr:hypothetical protein AJ78_01589 [Emergomyces pasteurianus Ep9510]
MNDASHHFKDLAILRFTMKARHAFITIVIITVDIVVTGAAEIDCTNNCFQTAVNNNGCDKWLSDPECCQNKAFLFSIASCISGICSQSASEEGWAHLAEQCRKADVSIPSDYTDLLSPPEQPPTNTDTTTKSTTSTSTSAPAAESTTASTTKTLPTGSPTAGESSRRPSPTTTTTATANPGGAEAPTDNNGNDGSGDLSTAAKVAIGVTIPFLFLCMLVALFLWVRQRRRKQATPSSTEAQNNEAQEIKPLVYEMPGTEISGNYGKYDYAAELEAVDTSRGEGGGGGGGGRSILPMLDVNPTLSLPHILNSDNILDDRVQEDRELDPNAGHTIGSVNRLSNPGSAMASEPPPSAVAAALTNTSSKGPTTDLITPAPPPPIELPSIQMSLIESSINASLEDTKKIQSLLSSLEALEQRKRDSASKAEKLEEEEEAAVIAEEQALLEVIRNKTGKVPRAERNLASLDHHSKRNKLKKIKKP